MTPTIPALVFATTLGGAALAAPPDAANYPRTTGTGESVEIDYGPGPRGNIVGGGRVVVTGTAEDVRIAHLDPGFVQSARIGLMPVTVGSGEGSATVWVPAGTDRTSLALVGPDGSLPSPAGGTLLARILGDHTRG